MQFDVDLTGEFDFSKCRRFTVRGYNKAKLFSFVSTDIKDCKAFDPILIKPNLVIDAVGQPEDSKGTLFHFSDINIYFLEIKIHDFRVN